MIQRALFALLGALWLAGCGVFGGEEDWGEPSPALWQATGPQGQQLWLFGTIHALPDGVDWRTDALAGALAKSDLLMVEIVDLETPDLQATFKELSRTPGQLPLSQRVAPEGREAVRELLASARADDADFSDVETWGAALMLASAVRGSDPANGVDRALTVEAKTVAGLETISSQLGIFDTLPQSDQADFLLLTARSSAGNDGQIAARAWHKGDLDTLERLVNAPLGLYPNLYAALLADRNIAWMTTIEREVADGRRPFVAVGAAHMLGPEGLPQLLAERGFAVTRLQ